MLNIVYIQLQGLNRHYIFCNSMIDQKQVYKKRVCLYYRNVSDDILFSFFNISAHSQTLDIVMNKLNGSLGFTLRKEADSQRWQRGHHINALVRPPATTDGRLCCGDRIDAVNGVPIGHMTHEEAVALLRCSDATEPVRLRLYRSIGEVRPEDGADASAQTDDNNAEVEARARHTLRAHTVRRLNALADRSKLFCYEDVVAAC